MQPARILLIFYEWLNMLCNIPTISIIGKIKRTELKALNELLGIPLLANDTERGRQNVSSPNSTNERAR